MSKYVLLIVFIFMLSCRDGKPPRDAKIIEQGSKISSDTAGNYQIGNFAITIPDAWNEEKPASQMRIAQFRLKDSPDYEMVVSYFGDMGTKASANIERWENQFIELESSEELNLENKDIKAVKLLGIYKQKPFPMSQEFLATEDFGMLAAIISTKDGPYFFKLTAPKDVLEKQEAIFIEVLNSYRD